MSALVNIIPIRGRTDKSRIEVTNDDGTIIDTWCMATILIKQIDTGLYAERFKTAIKKCN